MGSSKILIIGATGYLGKFVANASIKLGHPTFLLVRSTNPSDPTKAELLKSFKDAGVTLLVGDLADHASLVAALRQVDVVISVVGGPQIMDQINILDAAKEAGTIKRFVPSEFGGETDRTEFDVPLSKTVFEPKIAVRRAAEKSGIPYTFIVSNTFAGWYLATLGQENIYAPPRDGKLVIWGDGNAKVVYNDENDIAIFTIKAVDDPRAANKIVVIKPKENVASQNEVIALWEKKIGHTFEKEFMSKEEVVKSMSELPVPQNILRYILYAGFVKGETTNYDLDPSKELEATALYPDVKYTTVDEYLSRLV